MQVQDRINPKNQEDSISGGFAACGSVQNLAHQGATPAFELELKPLLPIAERTQALIERT